MIDYLWGAIPHVCILLGLMLSAEDFRTQHVNAPTLLGFVLVSGLYNWSNIIPPLLCLGILGAIYGAYYYKYSTHPIGLADFGALAGIAFWLGLEQLPYLLIISGALTWLLYCITQKSLLPLIPALMLGGIIVKVFL
jgi:prepilin signal peptidase PulO-like enzyme (type II secretory pathway)